MSQQVSEQSLIAEPGSPSKLSGTFLLDDVNKLSHDLASGNWKSGSLIGITTVIDLAATIADPLGSLIAAGLGWVMDHLDPPKTWLNELTGDPGAVEAMAGTWENVAEALREQGTELAAGVRTDLGDMAGQAIATYLNYMRDLGEHIEVLSEAAEGMGEALKIAGAIVDFVHGLVRDLLAQLVGSIISYAAEEIFSLGLATPLVVAQVDTRVAEITARLTGPVRDVITSTKNLKALVERLDTTVGEFRKFLEDAHIHPDTARGEHQAPWLHERTSPARTPAESGRHRAPNTPDAKDLAKGAGEKAGEAATTEGPRDVIGEAGAAGGTYYRGGDEEEGD